MGTGTKSTSITLCSESGPGINFETTLFVAQGSFVITQVEIGEGGESGDMEVSRVSVHIDEGGAHLPDILRQLADQLELEAE